MAKDDLIELLLYLARKKEKGRDDTTIAILLTLIETITLSDAITLVGKYAHPVKYDQAEALYERCTYGADYLYQKLLTIDQTKIDTDLADFSVLVKLDSTNFDFSHSLSSGYDIRFLKGSYLDFEIERYDAASEVAEFWVRIPSISSTVDTKFYMVYGKTGMTDASTPTAVWDVNFKMVQHMNDATTSTILDSTSNNNDGTKLVANEPVQAAGKIGYGQTFDGNDDKIQGTPSGLPTGNVTATLSTWIKITAQGVTSAILSYGEESNNRMWGYGISSTGLFFLGYNNDLEQNWSYSLNTWYHVALVTSGTNVKWYVNGVQLGLDGTLPNTPNIGSTFFIMGKQRPGNPVYYTGLIDEVCISNIARPAAWIKAEYNSGNNTLLTYGTEATYV